MKTYQSPQSKFEVKYVCACGHRTSLFTDASKEPKYILCYKCRKNSMVKEK